MTSLFLGVAYRVTVPPPPSILWLGLLSKPASCFALRTSHLLSSNGGYLRPLPCDGWGHSSRELLLLSPLPTCLQEPQPGPVPLLPTSQHAKQGAWPNAFRGQEERIQVGQVKASCKCCRRPGRGPSGAET